MESNPLTCTFVRIRNLALTQSNSHTDSQSQSQEPSRVMRMPEHLIAADLKQDHGSRLAGPPSPVRCFFSFLSFAPASAIEGQTRADAACECECEWERERR